MIRIINPGNVPRPVLSRPVLSRLALALLVLGHLLAVACDDTSDVNNMQSGTESHFLVSCSNDGDCVDELDCLAGRCSVPCDGDATCSELAPSSRALPAREPHELSAPLANATSSCRAGPRGARICELMGKAPHFSVEPVGSRDDMPGLDRMRHAVREIYFCAAEPCLG